MESTCARGAVSESQDEVGDQLASGPADAAVNEPCDELVENTMMTNRCKLEDVVEDTMFVERSEPRCSDSVLRAMNTTNGKLVGELGLRSVVTHLGRAAAVGRGMHIRWCGNVRWCEVTHRVSTYHDHKLLVFSGAMREGQL